MKEKIKETFDNIWPVILGIAFIGLIFYLSKLTNWFPFNYLFRFLQSLNIL